MSGHGHHDADADLHAGHDDHHDETTSDDFPADEPHSPGWLPLLGGGLLLACIFAWLAMSPTDATAEPAGAAPAVVAAKPKLRPAPAPVQPPLGRPAVRPAPPIRPGSALPPGHDQLVRPQ